METSTRHIIDLEVALFWSMSVENRGRGGPAQTWHRARSNAFGHDLPLFFCTESLMYTCNTCVSSYRDENPVCCSCVVLYVGSRGAEPPAGPAAQQHEEQLDQGGTSGLACSAVNVSNLGTQVCAAARRTGGSEEQGAQEHRAPALGRKHVATPTQKLGSEQTRMEQC